ncbi:MAG TPA: hypothetical protein VGK63_02690 [Candidatus Limnocylindrales bacterium]
MGHPHARSPVAAAALPAVLAVALVAGCGSSSPDPLASPAAAASVAPPSATPVPHEVPDLEARLPASIHGTRLAFRSFRGASFLRTGSTANQGALRGMLADLDRSVDDLTLALADDPSGSIEFIEGIFRVSGAPPGALEDAWIASQQAATQHRLVKGSVAIGGLTVDKVTDAVAGGTTYILPRGDSLVLIIATDPAIAAEAVSKVR